MIVVRCQTGIVMWDIRFVESDKRVLFCMADGFSVNYNSSADATQEAALVSAAAHSVALKGAVLQVVQITL